jgi:hypothetical protein
MSDASEAASSLLPRKIPNQHVDVAAFRLHVVGVRLLIKKFSSGTEGL